MAEEVRSPARLSESRDQAGGALQRSPDEDCRAKGGSAAGKPGLCFQQHRNVFNQQEGEPSSRRVVGLVLGNAHGFSICFTSVPPEIEAFGRTAYTGDHCSSPSRRRPRRGSGAAHVSAQEWSSPSVRALRPRSRKFLSLDYFTTA